MNKLMIIGNLTADPQMRNVNTVNGQVGVCSFTVAVNNRSGGENNATFINVSAWRQLGENCSKYLAKGRKVAVTGQASARAYKDRNGDARAVLELRADDVEFLSPKAEQTAEVEQTPAPAPQPVEISEADLPF